MVPKMFEPLKFDYLSQCKMYCAALRNEKGSEVRRVYEELYSGNILQQKHALGRIDVWKSRSLHKLPLALESTATFIKVKLEHQRAGLSVEDDRHLRSLYSMALIRFVNHVTEKGQGKAYAQPVHLLAANIGVPEWIVDLRHEATHGTLPSLVVLKAAADWALQWLKREFWEIQKQGTYRQELQHVCDIDMKRNTLQDLLVAFQQRRFIEMVEEENIRLGYLIRDLGAVFFDLRGEVYDCLTEDGYLVSTEEQLSSLGIDVKELLKDESMTLPKMIAKFWKPVIRLLDKHGLLTGFVLNLASCVTHETSLRNWQICAWIIKLAPQEEEKYTEKFKPIDCTSFKWLLKKCGLMENPYSPRLMKILTDRVGAEYLSNDKKILLQKLSQMYWDENGKDVNGHTKLKKVTDILKVKGGFKSKIKASSPIQNSSDSSWRLCTGVKDWSKYPLGVLPNQTVSFKTLELFTDEDTIEQETIETETVEETMETENITEDWGENSDSSEAEVIEDSETTVNQTSRWSEETLEFIRRECTKDNKEM